MEWVKLFGALFGKEQTADSVAASVARAYDSLKTVAAQARSVPEVLTGYPMGGDWLAGGGKSYMAQFLRDAGARSVWEAHAVPGTITVTLESALAAGADAPFWLHPSLWKSREEILAQEPRVDMLGSFKKDEIWQIQKRVNPNGFFDFYESGIVRPDLILRDLLRIFHPELSQDSLVYYERIE
jgi:iron complex transport system substrate-binding protein